MKFFRTKVGEIHSRDILTFIEELEAITGVPSSRFVEVPLQQFLMQCLYPDGLLRVKLHKNNVIPGSFLSKTIHAIRDTDVYVLLHELMMTLHGQSAESNENRKVFALLNAALPDVDKKPKKPKSGSLRDFI